MVKPTRSPIDLFNRLLWDHGFVPPLIFFGGLFAAFYALINAGFNGH